MISCTTKEFWKLFDALPKDIQKQAVKAYKVWNNTPVTITQIIIQNR